MKTVWPHWSSLQRVLRAAKRVLIFFDYDGTLVPIAKHPAQGVLPPKMKRLLRHVAEQPGVQVAFISGRALHNLQRMIQLPGVYYIGNHGLELEGRQLRYRHPHAQQSRPHLHRLARSLRKALQHVPGAWVEDKRFSLSVHWRLVPPSAQQRFHEIARACLTPDVKRRTIRVTEGKRVIEVHPPVRWGKGESVRWLKSHARWSFKCRAPLTIYLGDDQTDESAFRAVNRYHGLSIFVGPRPRTTAARWRLNNPKEVSELLSRLLDT